MARSELAGQHEIALARPVGGRDGGYIFPDPSQEKQDEFLFTAGGIDVTRLHKLQPCPLG